MNVKLKDEKIGAVPFDWKCVIPHVDNFSEF